MQKTTRAFKALPSIEWIKERLDYDPETGIFTWKFQPGRANYNARFAGKVAGCLHNTGRYWQIQTTLDGKKMAYLAHRLAYYYVTGVDAPEIDHANRDGLDNRFANLRIANRQENCAHRMARGTTRHGNKWFAQISHEGIWYNLGLYPTEELAHQAYRRKSNELRGEFSAYRDQE